MPDEPNKTMEDLLRAYARKREPEPAFELHPATRLLLRDEAMRSIKAASRPKGSLLAALLPRIAFGGGIFVLLLGGLLVLQNGRFRVMPERVDRLARNSAAPEAALPPAENRPLDDLPKKKAESLGLAPEPELKLVPAREQLAEMQRKPEARTSDESLSRRGFAEAPGSPATGERDKAGLANRSRQLASAQSELKADASALGKDLAAPSEPEALKQKLSGPPAGQSADVVMLQRAVRSESTASASAGRAAGLPAARTAAVLADQLAAVQAGPNSGTQTEFFAYVTDGRATNAGAEFVQLDSRAQYRRNVQSPPLPKILQSFRLEQQGNHVRFLDADGSIYEGEAAASGADPQGQAGAGQGIHAQGVSRQLNRAVTIDGVLQAAPAAAALNFSAGGRLYGAGLGGGAGVSTGLQFKARINIGTREEFSIEAVPANQVPKK